MTPLRRCLVSVSLPLGRGISGERVVLDVSGPWRGVGV